MARLARPPRPTALSKPSNQIKTQQALQWLRDNPDEKPKTAARIWGVENEESFRKAWQRLKKRDFNARKPLGRPTVLRPDQHQAMIRYAVDQATNGGKGATKQMMYNCTMWFSVKEQKPIPT